MKLQLLENKVNQLVFMDADGQTLESEFTLSFEPVFFDENTRKFNILFDFEFITEDSKYLRVDYHSSFLTDTDIDDKFRASKFPIVNAPAIAFPFLRAFIANLLISSGNQPILLPSINFVNFKQETLVTK